MHFLSKDTIVQAISRSATKVIIFQYITVLLHHVSEPFTEAGSYQRESYRIFSFDSFVVEQTRNALSGTYSAPQRSASSAALLIGDPAVSRDRAGNFVLPRADVMKLRDRLKNEEAAAGCFGCGFFSSGIAYLHDSPADMDHRRRMCAHARILALEEAIDTEWVYMWDKFGGYLLLLLGLTAKAEQIQV